MPDPTPVTVGAVVAAFLERCGVQAAFGVISIHNMPILDAIAERGRIRFVMARGEAGATNMADACARTTRTLGVALTSTGTAAGNAAGAMVEALTAGTPLLHLTGQIETAYLDRDLGYIHEAPDQLTMLRAVSKAAFRVTSAETALGTLKRAVQTAMTAPTGPVSVEIPIDIQAATMPMPTDLAPLPVAAAVPADAALDALAEQLARARRPLLWLGGGARHAGAAVARLMALGVGVVSTTQGRGIVAEDDPRSLGAYQLQAPIEAFYGTCDALVVVGSRLRGNETLKYALKLPRPLHRIDADPTAEGRGYASETFVCGDAALALDGLADRLAGRLRVDPAFAADLADARRAAEAQLLDGLGPYAELVGRLQAVAGRDFNWVRDVTVSNSTWGNRQLKIFAPTAGVHALGGGIGQGLAMAVGAAVGATVSGNGRKTFCLSGDGGFILNLGELATAVQERADIVFVLMNDQRYGVIRNIQDAQYGGRRHYVELHTPDYALLCQSLGVGHVRLGDLKDLPAALDRAVSAPGPFIVEVDMRAVGAFRTAFAGPPTKVAAAPEMQSVAIVGCGAIGASVLELLHGDADLRVDAVVARAASADRARALVDRWAPAARVVESLGDTCPDVLLECAGHSAIEAHVLPALGRGIACVVASVGALADAGLAERLADAARSGATQVQLLPGAIGGIDALAAARIGGLDRVVYTGRKPPNAWRGTPAERDCDLGALTEARCIFDGTAADAARLYPKNANVAATLALAGLGLARTQVRLFADPAVTENVHHVAAEGAFGRFELTMRGRPLAANPKTSALTVFSAVRALRNRVRAVSI